MSFGLQIKVNAAGADAALQALVRSLDAKSLQAPLQEIGLALSEDVRLAFTQGQSPTGAVWQPSQRATEQGGQTLLDTGVLRNSIDFTVDGTNVYVGTNDVRAPLLDQGGDFLAWGRTPAFMPPRPFLEVSEAALQAARQTLADYVASLQ